MNNATDAYLNAAMITRRFLYALPPATSPVTAEARSIAAHPLECLIKIFEAAAEGIDTEPNDDRDLFDQMEDIVIENNVIDGH